MNLHLSEAEQVHLTRAVLLYEAPHGNQAFATLHPVTTGDDAVPIVGAGQCLTREAIEETLASLLKRPQHREILPANVLWSGDSRLCWYVQSSRRPIFFRTTNRKFNQDLNAKEVLHPPLAFLARPGRLSVWALATNDRPEGATQLYQAPYYNIYDGGLMCNGNTHLPDVPNVETIAHFERAFFETNFTHTNAAKLVAIPGGHDGFWKAQASTRPIKDWDRVLLPIKLTLQEAINQ